MASPHVAGGLGLLIAKSNTPNLDEEIMYNSAEEIPYSGNYDYKWIFGAGLLRTDEMMNNSSRREGIERLKRLERYKKTIKKAAKAAWKILY
jgi:hypothetical protein